MYSKPYQKFQSKIGTTSQHLQVLDASIKTLESDLTSCGNKEELITKALNISPTTHVALNQPVKEKARLISYSRSRISEHAMLEIFGAFTSYMKDITAEMFDSEPMKIVGKVSADSSSLTYAEIIKLGTIENIAGKMVDEIFRKFENERSTIKLIEKILSHTKVIVDKDLKEKALMYLEMRHLFIHAKGIADEKFKTSYPNLKLKQGDKLPTNFKTVTIAIKTIQLFAKSIDDQLLAHSLLKKV